MGWMLESERLQRMSTLPPSAPQRLAVRYFDGRSSRAQHVDVWVSDGQLHLAGEGLVRTLSMQGIRWPERTRKGPRIALLSAGGHLQSIDAVAWDNWSREAGFDDSTVVKLQQSWRWVFASLVSLVLLMVAGYVWGLPWAAREVADRLPDSAEVKVGEVVAAPLDAFTKPSQLPLSQQQNIEQAWEQVLTAHRAAAAARGESVRPSQLLIRHSDAIGPNALAIPGGTMLLTDDMVRLLQNDTQAIVGVLGHELGHVQHRHGMRMVIQVGVMGAIGALLWGDFSSILATVPLWLGQAHYSREAEREADAYSVDVLRASGISPAVMVTLFERLALFERCGDKVLKQLPSDTSGCEAGSPERAQDGPDTRSWRLGFASHPASEDRIAFFLAAAR